MAKTNRERHKIYDEMLKDFMLPNGGQNHFLTDEQYWVVHQLGNGIDGLYEIPRDKWQEHDCNDHIFNSTVLSKKKMTDYILDAIAVFGLKKFDISQLETIEPVGSAELE